MRPPLKHGNVARAVAITCMAALAVIAGLVPGTATAGGTTTVVAEADTTVSASKPGRSMGSQSTLEVGSSPTLNSYLRFTVAGLPAATTSVTLRLRALDAGSGYSVRRVDSLSWSESKTTWNTAPALGAVVGSTAPHAAGVWTSVDLTSAVPGDGTYSFALVSAGNKVRYSSREGSTPPELVVATVAPDAVSSTPAPVSPSPVPQLTAGPNGPADLRDRTDLIYGTEIGAWRSDGGPAVRTSSGIPTLVQDAMVPVVRFSVYDAFTDMSDPTGAAGTQSRARFDAALNGIRDTLGAEPFIKLLPIANELIGSKNGGIYCPPKDRLTSNLGYYKEVVKQAGSRVRLYESTNEMEYSCSAAWGFSSAGSTGVSTLLGKHYAQNMPALKKYARSTGVDIATVGYVGVSGGPGWGDSTAVPRTRSMTEFMTAVHEAYLASGKDPDYIPDAVSIHAYPYSPDFGLSTPLSDIIAYFDSWTTANRAVVERIWGPEIGNRIKLVMSEWNAGNSSWAGFQDQRVEDFYTAWLGMLRRNGFWMANQFAIASNESSHHDMIREDGTVRRQYHAFKAASIGDPLRTGLAPAPTPYAPVSTPLLQVTGITEGQLVPANVIVQAVPSREVSAVTKVQFDINGTPVRTESVAPYCLNADDGVSCYPFNTEALTPGSHTLTATMHYGSGSTATVRVGFTR